MRRVQKILNLRKELLKGKESLQDQKRRLSDIETTNAKEKGNLRG